MPGTHLTPEERASVLAVNRGQVETMIRTQLADFASDITDFTPDIAELAADIAELAVDITGKVDKSEVSTQTMAGALALPYILPTYRGLKISEFLTSTDTGTDQRDEVQDAIAALADDTRYYALDFEGLHVGVSGSIAPTGSLTSARRASLQNGRLVQLADQPVTSVQLSGTTTLGSATITMADTTGLAVGDHISGAGIPREAYIVSIVANTSVSMSANNRAYTSATNTLTFTRFPYGWDFAGMTTFSDVSFRGLYLGCHGRIGGIRLPANAAGVNRFIDCEWFQAKGRGITCIDPVSIHMVGLRGGSNEANVEPNTRTGIFANPGGDSMMLGCEVHSFLHAVVTTSSILYQNNHNFQGDDDFSTRTAQLVCTHARGADLYLVGNYLDNSGIEITDEANASAGGTPLGSVVMIGNQLVAGNDTAISPDFAWLVVRPFSENRVLRNIVVRDNIAREISGSNVDRIVRIDTTNGTISTATPIDKISIGDNITRNVTYPILTRPTATKSVTVAATDWDVHFTHDGTSTGEPLFPFGMTIQRVINVEIIRLKDGSDVAQFDRPNILVGTADSLATDYSLRLVFAAARKGTAYVTVDCNATDV